MNGLRSEWPGAWPDHGLVFTPENGEPRCPTGIGNAFDRAVKAARLPRIRLHDLRHSHATHPPAAGAPVKVVSERLGHSKVCTTMDVYCDPILGMREDAAAAIRRQNGGKPPPASL